MTHKAREVLEDCRFALAMLEEEQDIQRWRVLWAGAVALTRAVGHVIDRVDGQDPVIKQVSRDFFLRWKHDPGHEIFREFIEHERNNLLKEYRSDVHPSDTVPVAIQMPIIPVNGGETKFIGEVFHLDESIYRPLLEGRWEGIDSRDVLGEALNWWSAQLDAIDKEVKQRRNSPDSR